VANGGVNTNDIGKPKKKKKHNKKKKKTNNKNNQIQTNKKTYKLC